MNYDNLKRVELNTHTNYEFEELCDVETLIKENYAKGCEAVAITDFNCITAYNDAFRISEEIRKNDSCFKVIYGMQISLESNDEYDNHLTLLAKNVFGIKEIYDIYSDILNYCLINEVSTYAVKYNNDNFLDDIRFRNIVVGASCYNSQIFVNALIGEDINEFISKLDYIEIMPLGKYWGMVPDFLDVSIDDIRDAVMNMIRAAEFVGTLVVAVDDNYYRMREGINVNKYFNSINTMFEMFDYLSEEEAYKYIIENPKKIVDVVEYVPSITIVDEDNNDIPLQSLNENSYRRIKDIVSEEANIVIEGKIFRVDSSIVCKNVKTIMNYYVTDYTDSIVIKCFEGMKFDKQFLQSIKEEDVVLVYGNVYYDCFSNELVVYANSIVKKNGFEKQIDDCKEKRIELHAHTKLTEMAAVCDTSKLIIRAAELGHKAIAITDYMNVQAYPEAQRAWEKVIKEYPDFKVIYGIEMNMMDSERYDNYKHVTLLVKNQDGLKDLYKLVSLSNIDYLMKEEQRIVPCIPREEIQKLRKHLLVGSGCQNGEIFELAFNKQKSELRKAVEFYDYIEVQPVEFYNNFKEQYSVQLYKRVMETLLYLVRIAQEMGKIVVATGDVHYIDVEDKKYHDVYRNLKNYTNSILAVQDKIQFQVPVYDLKTTQDMLEEFDFLGKETAYEIVVQNSNKINDLIEIVKPLHTDLYLPFLDGAEDEVKRITYDNAYKQYGDPLPKIVEERIERELKTIIDNGYSVYYYVAYLLVKKSNEDRYFVGSRGLVGSSFVATMMNITEVNPLAPHYYCLHCQHSEWIVDDSVLSGYDLPTKTCPKCGATMRGEGHDIEFENLCGYYGEKVPDIDLNFEKEYQEHAARYIKELFGKGHVYRAGTITRVAEYAALGYVNKYLENRKTENIRDAEKLRLAQGCQDVKRTTGQHPGGIIVIPQHMDVHDFTPVQFPGNNPKSAWRTTHFDFHAIQDNLMKIDLLVNQTVGVLRMLETLTGIELKTIPMNDPKVMSLFSSTGSLCLDTTGYYEKTGVIGVPEFGPSFVRDMLEDTLPTTFAELIKISSLSHGTDVWIGNAKDLMDQNVCKLKDVIGCRDDILSILTKHGIDRKVAFDTMEAVRKGCGLKHEMIAIMEKHNVPKYIIDSCSKIKYLFPKSHAVSYVINAYLVAWFKVYYPQYFYATWLTLLCDAYDIEGISKGLEEVQKRMVDILYRKSQPDLRKYATNKESALITTYEVVEEMYLRGYSIAMIDLDLSLATEFRVHPENDHIIVPPFTTIEGLEEDVANSIVEARNQMSFNSKEDLLMRTLLSKQTVEELKNLGVLSNLLND